MSEDTGQGPLAGKHTGTTRRRPERSLLPDGTPEEGIGRGEEHSEGVRVVPAVVEDLAEPGQGWACRLGLGLELVLGLELGLVLVLGLGLGPGLGPGLERSELNPGHMKRTARQTSSPGARSADTLTSKT